MVVLQKIINPLLVVEVQQQLAQIQLLDLVIQEPEVQEQLLLFQDLQLQKA